MSLAMLTTAYAGPTPTVTIAGMAFLPTEPVVLGDVASVLNADLFPHSVTSENGLFDTGIIKAGGSGAFDVPSATGVYPYFCVVHDFMKGVLVVQ